jgi:hypothetical protein
VSRQNRNNRKTWSELFEIEPLLFGELIAEQDGATTFKCKTSELAAVLEDSQYDSFLSALRSVKRGRFREQKLNDRILVYLLSPQLPKVRNQYVGIFHQASLITATTSLASADPNSQVTVTVISDVADPETLYQMANPPFVRFNSDLPKLKLRIVPTQIRILSEPFVINEEWGYSPVMEVEVPSGDRYYIALNRSLRDIFENGRRKKSGSVEPTIVGNTYRVWKKSDNPQSGFDGLEIQDFVGQKPEHGLKVSVPKNDSLTTRSSIDSGQGTRYVSSRRSKRRSNASFCEQCRRKVPTYWITCGGEAANSSKCPIFFS